MMLAPVAFLPLVALPTFLIGGPMLAVNVLSTFPYLRDIRYHWSSLVLAGVMLGTVEAIAFLGRRPGFRRFLVGLVVACSLGSTVAWGASPLGVKYHSGIWPLTADARQSALEDAVARVPDGAATTATYQILPHLAHRERIYSWPEPWRRVNWGVKGENLPDSAGVEWLAIDRTVLNQEDVGLLEHLSHDDVVVAQRVHPPPRS